MAKLELSYSSILAIRWADSGSVKNAILCVWRIKRCGNESKPLQRRDLISFAALIGLSQLATVPFAQFLQRRVLNPETNASGNFDDRPNRCVLRPPAVLMFYDFAPHGDGANNGRPPVVEQERFSLCLLDFSKCVVAEVVRSRLLGARTFKHTRPPSVRNEHAIQKSVA